MKAIDQILKLASACHLRQMAKFWNLQVKVLQVFVRGNLV